MTRDEARTQLSDMIANPDRAAALAVSFGDAINGLFDEIDAKTAQISDQESRIRDLQDTNMKLFLSQAGPAQARQKSNDEKTADELFDELIGAIEKE